MSFKIVLIAILICIGLTGCKFQRVETAAIAKRELAGMNKASILGYMGVPAGKEGADNIEVWSCFSGGDVNYYGSGNSYSTGSAKISGNTISGSSSTTSFGHVSAKKRHCKIDLVFSSGYVSVVNYSGRTGGLLTKDEQCAFAVQNCVTR